MMGQMSKIGQGLNFSYSSSSPSLLSASWLGWNGMMGRGAAARHPFAALSSHMLFFVFLLCTVFCSSIYFALPCILLFFVFCFSLYFALPCILPCPVFCSFLYFALPPVFCSSFYFALPCILLLFVFCSALYFALLCILLCTVF